MTTTEPQKLLHISHTRQDEAWVQGTLIPALGLAIGEYWTREEDDPGAPRLAELSRAVRACRYTLLVASRAAAVNAWTTFAGEIAGQLGLEEGKPRLLVIALDFAPDSQDAKEILSLEQRALACFDCRDAERTPAALAALAATLALATRPSPPIECPYPGLRMFGEGDPATMFQRTDLFFGRDAEARGLVDQLRATRRALVLGPSGCGKSSLVRARVLPTLTTGDRAMTLVAARPGPAPGRALRDAVHAVDRRLAAAVEAYLKDRDQAALVAAVGGPARLVYLDQLEEVFAAPADARAEMFAWLAALGEVPGVAILLGMRTDFYDDLIRSPSWDSFKDHRVELSPLRGAGLREAIMRPAEAVGVHVEVDLVERLVREAEADRAAEALPLLQVALEQLWAQRTWRYLSLDSYARLAGDASTDARRGLDVVFARHADATIEGLAEPARVVARRVLIDLVHFDDERPRTRRRRTEAELRRAGDDEAVLRAVLDRLAARRLVVVGAELTATVRHVDLAHDALITGWPALASWIRERREDLLTQRRLEARAATPALLTADELPEFTRWVAWIETPVGQSLGTTEALRALVRRSVAARRLRRGGFGLGLVVAITFSIVFGLQNVKLGEETDRATTNAERASLKSAEAEREAVRANRNAEQAKQEAARADQKTIEATQQAAVAKRNANEARRNEQESTARLASLYEAEGRQELAIGRPGHAATYLAAAYEAATKLDARDTHMIRAMLGLATPGMTASRARLKRHDASVVAAAYSHDGRIVATYDRGGVANLWAAHDGAHLGSLGPLKSGARSIEFNADSSLLLTSGDAGVRVWDVATRTQVYDVTGPIASASLAMFSPAGTWLLVSPLGSAPQIRQARDGTRVADLAAEGSPLLCAAFDADEQVVVTGWWDGSVRVYRVSDGMLVLRIPGNGSAITSVDIDDHYRIATVGVDGTTHLYQRDNIIDEVHFSDIPYPRHSDIGILKIMVALGEHSLPIVRFIRGTDSVLFGDLGAIWRFDIAQRRARFLIDSSGEPFASLAIGALGRYVVTGEQDGRARLWELEHGELVAIFDGHSAPVRVVGLSPEESDMVTGSEDNTARLWTTTLTTSRRVLPGEPGFLSHISFPNPKTLMIEGFRHEPPPGQSGVRTGNITLRFDIRTLELTLSSRSDVDRVDPEARAGGRVVTWPQGGDAATVFDDDGRVITTLSGHIKRVSDAALRRDGRYAVTSSWDGMFAIWDVQRGGAHVATINTAGMTRSVKFSPDGTRIAATTDHFVKIWTLGQLIAPGLVIGDVHADADYPVFSSDGSLVAVFRRQQDLIEVWSVSNGRRQFALPAPHRLPYRPAVAFSRDGRWLVTNGNKRGVNLWQVNTGLLVTNFDISSVYDIAITPDDRYVIVVTEDERTIAFPLPVEARPTHEVVASLRLAEGFELRQGQISQPAPTPGAPAPPRPTAPRPTAPLTTHHDHD